MLDPYFNVLMRNKLFEGISGPDLNSMLDCLNPRLCDYDRNDYIAFAGEKSESIGIVVQGSAAVLKEDADGNRVIMALLKPGDMFGEMAVFSGKPVWPANVKAQEKCTICFIQSEKIIGTCKNVCQWHTVLIQNLLKTISEKALLLNRKVEYLTIKSMRGRISAFLLEQYKKTGNNPINLPMNRNELAEFLNVSRSSMSRELCRMRDEGLIDFHSAKVWIKDLGVLKKS